MKKYIIIQSNKTIRVTKDLQYIDITDPTDSKAPHVIKPIWNKISITIYQGQHHYPAEIAEWETVKALQQDKVLTIGGQTFTEEQVENKSDIEQANKLAEAERMVDVQIKQNEKQKKEKIAKFKSLEAMTEGE